MQRFDCLAKETPIFGPHFLEASAGTGKTFAIEHVVARLILTKKLTLEQILVVTFTKAAARELKLRIRTTLDRIARGVHEGLLYLEEGADLRPIQDALATFDRCQIFTIHGFCARMLKEFHREAGLYSSKEEKTLITSSKREAALRDFLETRLSPDVICPEQLEILLRDVGSIDELVQQLKQAESPDSAKNFLERNLEFCSICPSLEEEKFQEDVRALRGNYKKGKGDLEGQIQALIGKNFAKLIQEKGSIFQIFSDENKKVRAKDPTLLHYPAFFAWGIKHLLPIIQSAASPREILQSLVAIWKPIDRKILAEEGTFSNDELLYAMQQTVKIELFCQKIQQTYGALIIDEFQDTDPLQWNIFETLFLSKEKIKTYYLIGDPKQSIYRFRRADLYTYLAAKNVVDPKEVFYLDTNFRSSKELINALNRLFDRNWLFLPKGKTTIPYLPVQAGKDLKTEFHDEKKAIHCVLLSQENIYAYAAREILRMQKEGLTGKDWAILVKDRYEALEMQNVLSSLNIPSHCRNRIPLVDTVAFEAIYEFLKALESPHNMGLAKRVLAGPFGQLSNRELQTLEASPFEGYRQLLDEKGLSICLQKFFQNQLLPDPQFHADCKQVLEYLLQWEQKIVFSFDAVFQWIDFMKRKSQEEKFFQIKEEGENDVQIMTMHMSKGLEFTCVFALGLSSRTPVCDEEIDAEKQRLLYVAATRAKKRLYIPILEHSKEAASGTESPIELFSKCLAPNWEESLRNIADLSFEKVEEPIILEAQKAPSYTPNVIVRATYPSFQSSYLLSFTSMSRAASHEMPLDPLPDDELPRGMETGSAIHHIFERIFLERGAWKNRARVTTIVQEELVDGFLCQWEKKIDEIVQATLDLQLPEGFCLRDLREDKILAEVEFMFEASPHYMKGFIDLLFVHEGKTYFIDWKTNWLKQYSQESLQEAMKLHQYDLQASIYAEALKKNLKTPIYAIYLFVRAPCAICFEPKGIQL